MGLRNKEQMKVIRAVYELCRILGWGEINPITEESVYQALLPRARLLRDHSPDPAKGERVEALVKIIDPGVRELLLQGDLIKEFWVDEP